LVQSIINYFYRHPKSKLALYKRFGGYLEYRKMLVKRAEMKRRAAQLRPVQSYHDGLPIYFLTGKDYLYQTLFCIQSLDNVTRTHFHFILVDDGSFDRSLMDQIARQLPGAECVSSKHTGQNLQNLLSFEKYPVLNQKRSVYPHLKKLTDIHTLGGSDWKLVLDSDMLFWKEPLELIGWLKDPVHAIHMIDCTESYGYSRKLMADLCGTAVPELLNVGAIGLNSQTINWSDLENWISELEREEGSSYYLEQALTAMLIGNKPTIELERDIYRVNPDYLGDSKAALHHYVDLSKKIYFNQAWIKVLN
jgi:hypothetical protein